MDRIKIELAPEEIDFAKRWANKRESDIKKKVKKNLQKNNSHFIGLLGELAFSQWSGYDIDTTLSECCGDSGVDFSINGTTIDVKTTCYDPPILKYDRLSDFVCDITILALITNYKNIFLCGWCSQEWFLKYHEIQNFGWGNRVVLPEKKLWSLNSYHQL